MVDCGLRWRSVARYAVDEYALPQARALQPAREFERWPHVDISVIIATRNREAWLPTCLTHLEHQNLPAAQFEVLVADCGSSDDTPSVVRRFAAGSPVRIRLVEAPGSGPAAARNRAAAHAEGRILLFLADDELASPRLLWNHAEAQERRDERGCITGVIHRHPQLPAASITRLSLDEGESHGAYEAPFYLDAQESNLSIPQRLFDRFNGFSGESPYYLLEHIELAYRLYREGVECGSIEDARSYVWQPVQFQGERERHYQLGYSLYHLLRLTGSKSILQRYRLRRSRIELLAARFLMPHYLRACRRQEQENMLFVGTLYRRILSHDRATGFEDARAGRPRRPAPAVELEPAPRPAPLPSLY